jgi:hypothetical protein
VKRQGRWNNPELIFTALALEPLNDVIYVELEVACAVFSLNKSKGVNVVVVPRR